MTKNYYELLGIALTNDAQQIKDAYTKKLRQHATDSAVFQVIQEAYATLTDAKKKYVHDMEVMYGPTIQTLRQDAQTYYRQENYDKAQQAYQELLQYFPEDAATHFDHGDTLVELAQYDRAIRAFERAIALDPKGMYYCAVGDVYAQTDRIQQAIRFYKQAIVAEPNRYEYVKKLVYVYIDQEAFETAWQLVETSWKKPTVHAQEKVLYTKNLLEIAFFSKDTFHMKLALKYVEKCATIGDQAYTIQIIGNFIIELAKRRYYKDALLIVETLRRIVPEDEEIQALYERIKQDFHIDEEMNALYEDETVFPALRSRIYLFYYYAEIEDADAKTDDVNDVIWEAMTEAPQMMKRSIQHVRQHYPTIADGMQNWLAIVEGEL